MHFIDVISENNLVLSVISVVILDPLIESAFFSFLNPLVTLTSKLFRCKLQQKASILFQVVKRFFVFVDFRPHLGNLCIKLFRFLLFFLLLWESLLLKRFFRLHLAVVVCYELKQLLVVVSEVVFRFLKSEFPFVFFLSQKVDLVLHVFVSQLSMEHLLFLVDELLHVYVPWLLRELNSGASYVLCFINLCSLGTIDKSNKSPFGIVLTVGLVIISRCNIRVPDPAKWRSCCGSVFLPNLLSM